jgi:F0F1-type ATP synthase epsilon subunit
MAQAPVSNFRCVVLSAKQLIFEGEIKSLFVRGDAGEYEILAYHYPLIGIVAGDIVIDWEKMVPVKGGVVRFFANECTVMIEEKLAASPEA